MTSIFDVCGTITEKENTFSYIYFLQKTALQKAWFFCTWLIGLLLSPIYGSHYAEQRIIKLMEGYSQAELDQEAKKYALYLKKHNSLSTELLKTIKKKQKTGQRVVLISASIETPIKAIAKLLSVNEYYATSLGFNKGKCTGLVKDNLWGKKQTKLESAKIDEYDVYTDNHSDLDLVNGSQEAFIITNSSSDEAYWLKNSRVTPNYIKLAKVGTSASISKSNYLLTYIPGLYYFLSRRFALPSVFLKELLPLLILSLSLGGSTTHLLISLYSLYVLYEIGIIYNDFVAVHKEANGTKRIAVGVSYNLSIFILIRVFLFAWLILKYFPIANYAITMSVSLALLLLFYIHCTFPPQKRALTMFSLRAHKALLYALLALPQALVLSITLLFLTQHVYSVFCYYLDKVKQVFKPKLGILIHAATTIVGLLLVANYSLPSLFYLYFVLLFGINCGFVIIEVVTSKLAIPILYRG